MKPRLPQLDAPVPRKRMLTAEEMLLWQQVMESGRRLHKPPMAEMVMPPVRKKDVPPAEQVVKSVPKRGPSEPQTMDTHHRERLRKGKLNVYATLDLHGHTVEEAHRMLVHFLIRNQGERGRVVLVITGKGRAPQSGILRAQLPRWLEIPPLAQCVISYAPAELRHGGEGAWYIQLRKHGGAGHA